MWQPKNKTKMGKNNRVLLFYTHEHAPNTRHVSTYWLGRWNGTTSRSVGYQLWRHYNWTGLSFIFFTDPAFCSNSNYFSPKLCFILTTTLTRLFNTMFKILAQFYWAILICVFIYMRLSHSKLLTFTFHCKWITKKKKMQCKKKIWIWSYDILNLIGKQKISRT